MRPCGEPGAAKVSVISVATKANTTRTCDMSESKSEGKVEPHVGILRLFMLVIGLSNRFSYIPIDLYTSLSLSLSDAPNLSDFILVRNAISKLITITDVWQVYTVKRNQT